jgi:hypothetical protein
LSTSLHQEIGGSDFWGKLKTYSGGGSVQPLHPSKTISLQIIRQAVAFTVIIQTLRELREFLWIDRATRLVVVRKIKTVTHAIFPG